MPPNDAFVDAVTLRPGRVQGSNMLATRELGEPAVAEGGGGSVWYRYRTNTRQRVTLDTSNSSFDTVLGVFTGDLGTLRKIASERRRRRRATPASCPSPPCRGARTGSSSTATSPRAGSFELGLSDGSIAGYGVALAEPQSTDLSTVLERGLRTTVGCRRSCSLELQVRVSQTTARRIGLPRSANGVLARTTGRLRGDGRDVAAVLRLLPRGAPRTQQRLLGDRRPARRAEGHAVEQPVRDAHDQTGGRRLSEEGPEPLTAIRDAGNELALRKPSRRGGVHELRAGDVLVARLDSKTLIAEAAGAAWRLDRPRGRARPRALGRRRLRGDDVHARGDGAPRVDGARRAPLRARGPRMVEAALGLDVGRDRARRAHDASHVQDERGRVALTAAGQASPHAALLALLGTHLALLSAREAGG